MAARCDAQEGEHEGRGGSHTNTAPTSDDGRRNDAATDSRRQKIYTKSAGRRLRSRVSATKPKDERI